MQSSLIALFILFVGSSASATVCATVKEYLANLEPNPQSFTYAGGSYNKSSDMQVRRRLTDMASAQADLKPALEKFVPESKGPLLEIGPLYSPTLKGSTGKEITYWDRDFEALKKLDEANPNGNVHPMLINFNSSDPKYLADFTKKNRDVLNGKSYNGVVISQVLNYVNYREVLKFVSGFQEKGGKIFIVNELNRGDAKFFHPMRPLANGDIERTLDAIGYTIVEKKTRGTGRGEVLTVVAEKKN